MVRGLLLLLPLLAVLAWPVAAQTEREPRVVRLAIVTDGPAERNAGLRALFLEELRAVNRGEFDIQAPADLQLEADWSLAGVHQAQERAFADPRTDVVIALGVLGSQVAAQQLELPKPVVAPFVTNRGIQRVPYKDGASGRKNLSYVSVDVDIAADLKSFREIVPFERLAFLIDGTMLQAMPGARDAVAGAARELGVAATPVAVGDAAAPALAALTAQAPDAQAVYVGPLLRLTPQEFQRLVDGLIARRLPSFAFSGESDVERGLMVGSAPALQMDRMARRVALNVRRILLGEEAGTLPVAFARGQGLVLNMRTARAIGYSPSWELLTRAELLHDEPQPGGPPLSLADAVREALALNLDLQVVRSNVAAGTQDVRLARAALRPQIAVSGQVAGIEGDDARATPRRAEQTGSASLQLEMPLYSEPARANVEVQTQLQRAREGEREQARLDVVLETTQAYLGLLRAQTNERIQKDNLRLTRSNLALAQARRRIGTAGPSEVLRWESELANAQRAVVEAQAQTRVMQIALNTLLQRPLEQAVATVELGLDEPVLIASRQRLYELIDNPARFRLFRDFLVEEGLNAAPELGRIDARIRAQERALVSARRAWTHPSLTLAAAHTQTLSRSGARGATLPGVDDHETTVALQLSIPLYSGGARDARQAKAHEELWGLRTLRQATAQRVEQRVRAALHAARSALTAIRLSRQAAEAASSNLDVVRDAYARGTVSVLDLLDAQNAALVGELRAATGVYEFLRALMEVERAASRFDFFIGPQEQADWLARVERYLAERGSALPGR